MSDLERLMLHKLVIKKSPNPHHIMTVFLSAAVSVEVQGSLLYPFSAASVVSLSPLLHTGNQLEK